MAGEPPAEDLREAAAPAVPEAGSLPPAGDLPPPPLTGKAAEAWGGIESGAEPVKPATKKQGCGIGHIRRELAGRAPHYVSDWRDGMSLKVLSATSYMFFASLAPAITLGAFLLKEVEGRMGPMEVLVSTFICGIVFSTFGGQGMVIVGVTGPVCIFAQTVFKLSDSFDEPFLPWMAWIAIWAFVMHSVIALTGTCHFVSWVTTYACETFGSLIGIIYVWTAAADVVKFFDEESRASAMWSLIICLGTYYCSEQLANAREWSCFGEVARDSLSNYAVPISIIVWTVLSLVVRDELDVDTPRVQVADTFGPTIKDRDWLVNPGDCSGKGIGLAIVPAAVLTVLFFFDHNVSSLMAQAPEFKLKKPPAYNWDFLIIGVMILICGMLGIPFTNGLIPQAPLHVHALATRASVAGADGLLHETVVKVDEQRLSNFVHALVIGLCMTPPALQTLQKVPLAALSGLFLYMGMGCFAGNGFINRLFLPIQDPKMRSAVDYGNLEALLKTSGGSKEIVWYTVMQFILWVCIYAVTKTPAAISFPIWIASLVVIRWLLLPKLFSKEAIEAMDGKDEHEVLDHHMEHDLCGNWDGVGEGEEDLTHHTGGLHFAFAHETHRTKRENEILMRVKDDLARCSTLDLVTMQPLSHTSTSASKGQMD